MPQTVTFLVTDNAAQSHFHNDVKLNITTTHVITGGSFFLCDAAPSGSFNITLPDAALWLHRMITIKKTTAANTVTVDTTSSQTIDGATTNVLTTQYDGITVVSDGVNWHIEP